MVKHIVCKTVVTYPGKPQFVRVRPDDALDLCPSLESLAAGFRSSTLGGGFELIKNEALGDIVLHRAGGRVWECERLSKQEMRELARLLAIAPK